MKAGFLTLILAFAIATPSSASVIAQAEQDTPEAVAKAFVAATQTADWAKAASFMHPDSLAQFKKLFEPMFVNEKAAKLAGELFGVKSLAEFDQVSGAQIFEKLMSGIGGMMPGFNEVMGKASFDIIGQIAETPELVHLLYRTRAPLDDMQLKDAADLLKNVTITKLEVMTLKRHGNTWRLTISSEVEAMAQMFANISALAAAAPAEESKGAPRKAPARPANARKPARKP